MKRLAYISAASPSLEMSDIQAILNSAKRRNTERDVTGLLLFNGLNFMQFLEGKPQDVIQIYTAIIADQRHSGVVTILDEQVEARNFPDWSMQLAIVPAAVDTLSPDMKLTTDFLQTLPPSTPDSIRALLTGFNSMSQIRPR